MLATGCEEATSKHSLPSARYLPYISTHIFRSYKHVCVYVNSKCLQKFSFIGKESSVHVYKYMLKDMFVFVYVYTYVNTSYNTLASESYLAYMCVYAYFHTYIYVHVHI